MVELPAVAMVIVVPLTVKFVVHTGAIQTVSPEETGLPKPIRFHHLTHTL
jgi:hypothetical protein